MISYRKSKALTGDFSEGLQKKSEALSNIPVGKDKLARPVKLALVLDLSEIITDQFCPEQARRADSLLDSAQQAPVGARIQIHVGSIPPWQFQSRLIELIETGYQLEIYGQSVEVLNAWAHAANGGDLLCP